MAGEITRVSSSNHNVQVLPIDQNKSRVELLESQKKAGIGGKDFVLYIKDSKIYEASAFLTKNEQGVCGLAINVLADFNPV
jgi:hypothetical protein